VGKLLPGLKAALSQAHGGQLLAELSTAGKVTLHVGGENVELDSDDIQVRLQAKPGWAAAQGTGVVVVLNTELTPELIAEGFARDVVRLVQDRRKEMNLDFTDRIELAMATASEELQRALQTNAEFIAGETLANSLVATPLQGVEGQEVQIGDYPATLYMKKV
jgi:isoleucyl-tRNA synthetase